MVFPKASSTSFSFEVPALNAFCAPQIISIFLLNLHYFWQDNLLGDAIEINKSIVHVVDFVEYASMRQNW